MDGMIRVQRANVILDIRPDEKDKYMNMGYNVIDETGKVLEEALLTDVHELQAQIIKLKQELAAKNEEILKLKAVKKAKATEG